MSRPLRPQDKDTLLLTASSKSTKASQELQTKMKTLVAESTASAEEYERLVKKLRVRAQFRWQLVGAALGLRTAP